MRNLLSFFIVVVIAFGILITVEKPPAATPAKSAVASKAIPQETTKKQEIMAATAEKAPPPPVWTVTSSPHPAVSIETINTVLAWAQEKGLSREGAAYLTGNFIGESHLQPCGMRGDNGKAWGLAQWHPGRRADMPCGLIEQLNWAVQVEMPRDAGTRYSCACDALRGNDIPLIKKRLQQWERWGVLGNRWVYSDQLYNQIR
jgi:hypothetical protein